MSDSNNARVLLAVIQKGSLEPIRISRLYEEWESYRGAREVPASEPLARKFLGWVTDSSLKVVPVHSIAELSLAMIEQVRAKSELTYAGLLPKDIAGTDLDTDILDTETLTKTLRKLYSDLDAIQPDRDEVTYHLSIAEQAKTYLKAVQTVVECFVNDDLNTFFPSAVTKRKEVSKIVCVDLINAISVLETVKENLIALDRDLSRRKELGIRFESSLRMLANTTTQEFHVNGRQSRFRTNPPVSPLSDFELE